MKAVILVGINFNPGRIDYTPIRHQEVDLVGVNSHSLSDGGEGSFAMAAGLLAGMDVPVEDLVTHRFPIERFRDAVKAFIHKKESKAMKIVLEH